MTPIFDLFDGTAALDATDHTHHIDPICGSLPKPLTIATMQGGRPIESIGFLVALAKLPLEPACFH